MQYDIPKVPFGTDHLCVSPYDAGACFLVSDTACCGTSRVCPYAPIYLTPITKVDVRQTSRLSSQVCFLFQSSIPLEHLYQSLSGMTCPSSTDLFRFSLGLKSNRFHRLPDHSGCRNHLCRGLDEESCHANKLSFLFSTTSLGKYMQSLCHHDRQHVTSILYTLVWISLVSLPNVAVTLFSPRLRGKN